MVVAGNRVPAAHVDPLGVPDRIAEAPAMRTPVLLLVSLVAAACTTAAAPTASPGPTPTVAPSPSPTPSPTPAPSAAAFTFDIVPPEEPAAVRMAIPGEGVCFLVVVSDPSASPAPVAITASATGATIRSIEPASLTPGTVGEVWVVPDPATEEATAHVTFTATRGGTTRTIERSLPVFPMVDERAADARPYFDRWVAWLIAQHPELGITAETAWQPEFVSTLLVVSHYAYWSPDWEIAVLWHNMIAPYDWTEIQLRHRWTESVPSLAFRIDSVSGATEAHAVEPPEVVVR
jgi:hypothetical protein